MHNLEDWRSMSRSANKELGSEVIGYWCTGSYDTYAIAKLPDNVSAVAAQSCHPAARSAS